jgi:hypothetical protein
MVEADDELEKLLSDVRKTISENKQFLEKLADEAVEVDQDDEPEGAATEEEYEEL